MDPAFSRPPCTMARFGAEAERLYLGRRCVCFWLFVDLGTLMRRVRCLRFAQLAMIREATMA